MKRRREMADMYETYDGKRARNARERALRRKKLLATMQIRAILNASEIQRRREILQAMLQETDFLSHRNFQSESSFTVESVEEDPFGVFIEDVFEEPKKNFANTPGTISATLCYNNPIN